MFGEYGNEERRTAILDLVHRSMEADMEIGEGQDLKKGVFDSGDDETDDSLDAGDGDGDEEGEVVGDIGDKGEGSLSSSSSSSASSLF